MRDDFTAKTKDILAKRVGFICSNPECNMQTIGPNSDGKSCVSIGVAAHILAASKGGPRYDSNITSEQRQDINNGIWLCQSCSRIIDRDIEKYSTEVLEEWKQQAELAAADRLNKQLSNKPIFCEDDDVQKIKPDGYYEKILDNYKIRYYLEGNLLHVEQELKDGIIAYYIIDENGNMVDQKLPFPLEEYEVVIDPNLIVKSTVEHLQNGLKKEIIYMKWGKVALIIRHKDNRLAHLHIEKGFTINNIEKKFIIAEPNFEPQR
ncbi:MAG: hypothetical protein JKX79_12710 [Labilibaculum sp.]|nr:hypothetical protein [Labilibaculum sp.]